MKNKPIWWEKSVEYAFVLQMGPRQFVQPYDGNEEALADTSFCAGHNWGLVEFKREETDISSERKKFAVHRRDELLIPNSLLSDFVTTAIPNVYRKNGAIEPHNIVFGLCEDRKNLKLMRVPYWGEWVEKIGREYSERGKGDIIIEFNGSDIAVLPEGIACASIPAQGVSSYKDLCSSDYKNFCKYVEAFLSAKSGKAGTTFSGGYSSIIGVSRTETSDVPIVVSLEEFAINHLNMKLENPPEPPPPSPIMQMR